MFLNRLYFRSDTGEFIFRNYIFGGIVRIPTIDEDFKTFEPLKEYVNGAVTIVELEEGEYADEFNLIPDLSVGLKINVETQKLEFRYPTQYDQETHEQINIKPFTIELAELKQDNLETKQAIAELTLLLASPSN